MFGRFKKKQSTPKEELNRLLLWGFRKLVSALRFPTDLERRMQVTRVFGALLHDLRVDFPNATIEPNAPAMVILSQGEQEPDWDQIDRDFEHVVDQIRKCVTEDDNTKLLLMWYFICPEKLQSRLKQREE
jgi:hypothetical protein